MKTHRDATMGDKVGEGILILVALASSVVIGSAIATYYSGLFSIGHVTGAYVAVVVSSILVVFLMAMARLYYLRITEEIKARIQLAEAANRSLRTAYSGLMDALTVALDTRDHETHGHSVRVVALALAIADRLKLSPKERQNLILGGILHDIGKIGIPDSILYKQEPFTPEEWSVMKRHTEIGYRMVHRVPLLHDCSKVILHHHERWDGTGYPFGLKGHEIPIEAQVFAVADAVDAMTSKRPYKRPMSLNEVYAELSRCSGSHFAPHVVDVFLSLRKEDVATILQGAQETVMDESWLDELANEIVTAKRDEASERRVSVMAEEFASFAAHEISNPLTVISTAAQMLDSNQSNPEYSRTLARRILKAAEDVGYILSDLRALSAPTQLTAAVSPHELVEEVADELEPLARRDGVSIRLRFDEPLPRFLCDRLRFKQALVNLVKNAIEAAREDESERSVAIQVRSRDQRVTIAIHNRGPSIPKEDQERMFQPFFTTKQGGTGLGLVVAQKIIYGHNGQLRFRSHPRYGTYFLISLPAYGPSKGRPPIYSVDEFSLN